MIPARDIVGRSGLDPNQYSLSGVRFRPMPRWMRTILQGRATGITIGRTVFIQPEAWPRVALGHTPELVAHELWHVEQWRGAGWRFLFRYLSEYLRFRLVGADHDAAYHAISFEMEARDHAQIVRRVAS